METIFKFLKLTKTNLYKSQQQLYWHWLKQQRDYCIELNEKLSRNECGINRRINQKNLNDLEQCASEMSLNVAVLGVPNAGKSTFINNLINHRVCPTSNKVHTTRKANKAIYTNGRTQLVFYDTPGLVTVKEIQKHKLERTFHSSYRQAIQNADLIAVIHDVSNVWTRKQLHYTVIDALKMYPQRPSVLILNKIDTLKSKRITLELIRLLTNNTLKKDEMIRDTTTITCSDNSNDTAEESNQDKTATTSWNNFSAVFLISSITGDGVKNVHDYLIGCAKPRAWQFSNKVFSDEKPEDLIVATVKARLLDYLPQEIPYNLETHLEYYNMDNNTIYTSIEVICPTERLVRLIRGESNGRLHQITERITSDLVEMFGKSISLTIATKSKDKGNKKSGN